MYVFAFAMVDRSTYAVQFVVKSTCVADRLAINIPPPECGLCGLAIGTDRALPTGSGLLEGGRKLMVWSKMCHLGAVYAYLTNTWNCTIKKFQLSKLKSDFYGIIFSCEQY